MFELHIGNSVLLVKNCTYATGFLGFNLGRIPFDKPKPVSKRFTA